MDFKTCARFGGIVISKRTADLVAARHRALPQRRLARQAGCLLGLVLLSHPRGGRAQVSPTAGPTTRFTDAVRSWVRQLDDNDPAVRDRALLHVINFPGGALPIVEAELASPGISPEESARLQSAIKTIRTRSFLADRQAARDQWESRSLHDGYQKAGHTNPAWDAQVHRTIDLFLALGLDPLHGPPAQRAEALANFDKAIQAGCDDPLVLCLHGAIDGHGPDDVSARKSIIKLAAEAYPPGAKFLACVAHMNSTNIPPPAEASLPAKLLPELMRAGNLPSGEFDLLGDLYYDAAKKDLGGRGEVSGFAKAYRAAGPETVGALLFDARRMNDSALDPTSRTALGVGGEDKLHEAKRLLEKAWTIDPTDPKIPNQMLVVLSNLQVEFRVPEGPDDFDTWFDRAMQVNPDNFTACSLRLRYLDPGRHGLHTSPQRMIDFGKWCAATRNWRAGLPLILVQAHQHAADVSRDRAAYLQQPEVWTDGRDVYEAALSYDSTSPVAHLRRLEYAKWAVTCQKWAQANAMFEVLGNTSDFGPFLGRETYDYYREKSRRLGLTH